MEREFVRFGLNSDSGESIPSPSHVPSNTEGRPGDEASSSESSSEEDESESLPSPLQKAVLRGPILHDLRRRPLLVTEADSSASDSSASDWDCLRASTAGDGSRDAMLFRRRKGDVDRVRDRPERFAASFSSLDLVLLSDNARCRPLDCSELGLLRGCSSSIVGVETSFDFSRLRESELKLSMLEKDLRPKDEDWLSLLRRIGGGGESSVVLSIAPSMSSSA